MQAQVQKGRRGRPKKGPTIMLGVRVPPALHDAWWEAIEEDGKTLTDATIEVLQDALRQREMRKARKAEGAAA